jgi:spermidine synthase
MASRATKTAALLFGSGACALIYQVAWFREFRLIFGASTAATGAVLALFAGGLGAGGLWLGPRADRSRNPGRLYAMLELGVALSAALTPILLSLARTIYIGVGGTQSLGLVGGTLARLVLSAIVLGVPTFLMGGTLPSAARAVETDEDVGRRQVGWLYGVNTFGAVIGCLAANFWLLEAIGTRSTLLVSVGANLVVSVGAFFIAREVPPDVDRTEGGAPEQDATRTAVRRFVVAAAGIVGLAFFVMEIVWYRMLGPLLGGSVFTFGLILAVALFGIGLGGAAYGALEKGRRPSLYAFSQTALVEAVCIGIPLSIGDGVATFALGVRPLGTMSFAGHVLGWTLVTALVVLPAAFVAGLQFPMLIALLGQGRSVVGRETGLAYAANTGGAIAGSLLGGFVLLPWLGAVGCWRAVAALLCVLGLAAAVLATLPTKDRARLVLPVGLACLVVILLKSTGPTAVWRHGPIGVGRVPADAQASRNAWRDWTNGERRGLKWEADGKESSVALSQRNGFVFVINGKADGHIRGDAPTQVMSGVLGAILHPNPTTALVIGLGTGSSAGWLGAIPQIHKVDVVELEPAILRVAVDSAVVNQRVMDNPKVHVILGDARELMLTSRDQYDLIFSEPSNPYRAGIASLFTREYYEAVAQRLAKGGLFLQWVQAYDVDPGTVRQIYATLGAVFPTITTWELAAKDLLLIAAKEPQVLDARSLRAKIAEEPYRSALSHTWRAVDLEGMLSHFRAGPLLARAIAQLEPSLNTDDRNLVEFAFARSANGQGGFDPMEILETARARGEGRPDIKGEVFWDRVATQRVTFRTSENERTQLAQTADPVQAVRFAVQEKYMAGEWPGALDAWRSQRLEAEDPTELAVVGEMLADKGDDEARDYVQKLRELEPVEADVILARMLARQGKFEDAVSALVAGLTRYRVDPWPWTALIDHTLVLATDLARVRPGLAMLIYDALKQPFAGHLQDEQRLNAMLVVAGRLPQVVCAEALAQVEPFVPWRLSVLSWRSRCYEALGHPLASRAARELDEFLAAEPTPFGDGLTKEEVQ